MTTDSTPQNLILAASLADFLEAERDARKRKQWFQWQGYVENDNRAKVYVVCKSFGTYNQILRLDDDPCNQCLGHTLEKQITKLRQAYVDVINQER